MALRHGCSMFCVALACIAANPAVAEDTGHAHHHGHSMISPAAGIAAPTLELTAHADTMDGFNLELTTANFTFSPMKSGQSSDPAVVEGHAHIYVNGDKLGRIYGSWFHLSKAHLAAGENTIRVTLNDNAHSDWAVDGETVAAEVVVMLHGEAGHDDHAGHGAHDNH